MHAWRNAASTKNTTAGTEICAATVPCRTRVLASASSAPSLTSRASPTCATRFLFRARPEMPDIDAQDFRDRKTQVKKVQEKNAPAIVNAGMMGDRASIIFLITEEISRFIVR